MRADAETGLAVCLLQSEHQIELMRNGPFFEPRFAAHRGSLTHSLAKKIIISGLCRNLFIFHCQVNGFQHSKADCQTCFKIELVFLLLKKNYICHKQYVF